MTKQRRSRTPQREFRWRDPFIAAAIVKFPPSAVNVISPSSDIDDQAFDYLLACYERICDIDRRTHDHRKHSGVIGLPALAVAYALLFNLRHYGARLPHNPIIAEAALVSERTVTNSLTKLEAAGVLDLL